MPTMRPEFIEVHNPTRRHQIQALRDNHKICVAVDGSGNYYTALKAAFNVLCLIGERRGTPIEVCHVPDLDISDSAHDLQAVQVKTEALKEIEKWQSFALDDMYDSSSSDGPEEQKTRYTYVQATRFKEGQSVRGTLAYHVNERSRPKFLVMGMVGSGWAGDLSGQSGPESSSTMQHNLWCSRTTSIVVHPSLAVDENVVAQTARKWIVAVDGSGRSRSAFDDVCELCDARSDTIIVMHLLMESWEDQGKAQAAATAIENEYCELLEDLHQMDGRVQFDCVRVEKSAVMGQIGSDRGPASAVGEFIAEYAKKEHATFLAVGVDGAGVWHDSALKWKAKQRPTPGRAVRYLTSLEHAPCSVLVSLR
jgi:nucleotide-binding universal stress UspA family protein